MLGARARRCSAARGGGSPAGSPSAGRSRSVNSTASPDFAAQAAAGIANSGCVGGRRSRRCGGLARQRRCGTRRSRRRRWRGRCPMMRRARRSPGARASPISIAWAPRAAGAPVGWSVSSAVEVACGSLSPSVSRIGARSGRAISTEAAMPPRQSSLSTSVTARGRESAGLAGIDRGRGPGGVGDRVLAAHARGVLGGERGEAEHGLVGGLLLQPHLDGVVAAAAGADRERREHHGDQRSGHKRPGSAEEAPVGGAGIERRTIPPATPDPESWVRAAPEGYNARWLTRQSTAARHGRL